MSFMFLTILLIASFVCATYSFSPPWLLHPSAIQKGLKQYTTTILFSSSDSNGSDEGYDDGIEDFEKERMNIVRNLQRSYYRDVPAETTLSNEGNNNDSLTAAATLDPSTGHVNNLPLWRVGWVETPARRNCLNVHEMQYTHMFEKILAQSSEPQSNRDGSNESSNSKNDDEYNEETTNSNQPLYFGHLYLPGGTTSSKSGEYKYQLKTWHEELNDENRFDNYESSKTYATPDISTPTVDRSAVVGCLMQIIDHRRMEDGRLMILVQALERFVVEEIVQEKPYAVANVQILLDREELPWEQQQQQVVDGGNKKKEGVVSRSRKEVDEASCKLTRGKAVSASFCYHDYEFDRPKLPAVNDKYLTKDDVPWMEISHLLPFAKYSMDDICLDSANERLAHVGDAFFTEDDENNYDDVGSSTSTIPIERELWNGGITWDPPPVSNVIIRRSQDNTNCDTLETLLWLALDDFCRATGFVLPEEITCLLPPEMDYLDIKTDRYLSSNYPKIRRQKRLSYLAPALIENLELPMKGMRQVWLNTPSTTARLLGALERYEYLNNKMMGQFE